MSIFIYLTTQWRIQVQGLCPLLVLWGQDSQSVARLANRQIHRDCFKGQSHYQDCFKGQSHYQSK